MSWISSFIMDLKQSARIKLTVQNVEKSLQEEQGEEKVHVLKMENHLTMCDKTQQQSLQM